MGSLDHVSRGIVVGFFAITVMIGRGICLHDQELFRSLRHCAAQIAILKVSRSCSLVCFQVRRPHVSEPTCL